MPRTTSPPRCARDFGHDAHLDAQMLVVFHRTSGYRLSALCQSMSSHLIAILHLATSKLRNAGSVSNSSSNSSSPFSFERDRAWTLHCQGLRSPAIAADLSASERTVRSWIQQTREELAAELPDLRQTHLLLAIDSLRQLLANAWEQFEAERDADFDARCEAHNATHTERPALRPRRSNAPRYLALALALSIQKELNRLLGLSSSVATPPIENAAETAMPAAPSSAHPTIPAKTAMPLAPSVPHDETPTATATPPPHPNPRRRVSWPQAPQAPGFPTGGR
jgi:Putative ATPase subunit of terminase (gpP-like)